MKTIDDINLNQWFITRLQKNVPLHFFKSSIEMTNEHLTWVIQQLSGRYAVYWHTINIEPNNWQNVQSLAFEDSAELLLYNLIWN